MNISFEIGSVVPDITPTNKPTNTRFFFILLVIDKVVSKSVVDVFFPTEQVNVLYELSKHTVVYYNSCLHIEYFAIHFVKRIENFF